MSKERKSKKYLLIIVGLISILIVNKNYAQLPPNDFFFPNTQTVNGPGFFPFSNSQQAVTLFNECPNPIFSFDGPPSLSGAILEVGPAANGFETGSRDILVFDANGNLTFAETSFPLVDPFTGKAFDPSMGDILGLSFVPGNGFPTSGESVMITTTFNCDNGSSTSTSSSTSSSGSTVGTSSGAASSSGTVKTNIQAITSAISTEKNAKKLISIKDLAMGGANFSVSMALDELMSSVSDLQDLSSMLSDSDIMLGMATVQEKIDEVISGDNEAIMTLEPFKNTDPSVTNGELTTALTKVNMSLSELIMIKERIEAKIKKSEK